MKLGIISNAYFNKGDYVEGLKNLKKEGYSYFDYQEFISPKSFIYDLSDSEFSLYLQNLKNECDKNDVKVSQVHAVWYAPDDTEEKREYNFSHYFVKSIIGCKLLGCKYLVIHPALPFGCAKDKGKETLDINYKCWKRLLPLAKENGVTLCLENMPFIDFILSTPKQILDFVNNMADDNFKMCLDTGHVNVFGLNIYDSIILVKDVLKVYHIHDNKGYDLHSLLYHGNINWNDFIKANREIRFDGVYSLECRIDNISTPLNILKENHKLLFNSLKYIVSEIEK